MQYINSKFVILLILIYFKFITLLFSENLNKCNLLAGLSVDFEKIKEEKSIPACTEAINNNPNNFEYWHFLGRSYNKAKQYKKFFMWTKKAADKGYAPSQNNLGLAFELGEGVEQDYKQSYKWYTLSANQGYSDSQYNLGYLYYLGYGVEQDYKEAMKWFKLAAQQKNVGAQFELGTMYYEGEGVEQDYKEAIKWFNLAAEQGDTNAFIYLGLMYENGEGVEPDYKEALKWYQLAAKKENVVGQYNLGIMYYEGKGVEQDYKEAMKWFKLAAEQGDLDATNYIGILYEYGQGVEQDYKEAMKWYRSAADLESKEAQYNLGIMHYEGKGIKKDYKEAMKWLSLAAEQEYAEANNTLAEMYYEGEGVKQDYKQAFKRTKLAADKGNSIAQYNLGHLYYLGNGVEQDYKEAMRWFKLAANQQDAGAQNYIGVMYQNGYGINQDYIQAVQWYKLAANQQHLLAMVNLGAMYHNGLGVEQDYKEALKWYQLAAKEKEPTAQYNIGLLSYLGRGIKKDYKEAFKWYKLSADQGNQYGQYGLAFLYYEGHGVEQNYKKAMKWFKLAGKQGNADAYNYIGILYNNGQGVEQDYKEAMKWYRLAVDKGDDYGKLNIGSLFENGEGVKQDYKEALKWYKLSAADGNQFAQLNIGDLYFYGKELKQDYKEAMRWYELAAQQENIDAQHQIGSLYYDGLGVDQSFIEAYKWFVLAANQNNISSQYKLGEIYYEGEGVEKDYKEAMKWFKLAAQQGDAHAQYQVAHIYLYDYATETEAINWFKKVVENKYSDSELLAICSWDLYILQAYKTSLKANQKAIELGSMLALNNMGEYYEHGGIVEKDLNKAFDYYAKAAGYGELFGYYNLARHHFLGLNKNSNYKQAVRLIENALHIETYEKTEFSKVLEDFKYLLLTKKDIFSNYEESYSYLNELAFEGNVLASLLLADYYSFHENYSMALQWYNIVSMYEQYSENKKNKKYYTAEIARAGITRVSQQISEKEIEVINKEKDKLFDNWLKKALIYYENNKYHEPANKVLSADVNEEYFKKQEFIKEREYKYWDNIDFQDIEQIKLYKVRYPNGEFIEEANLKIKRLSQKPEITNQNKIISWGKYHALIIGNNNYQNLPKLKNAVNDANSVSKLLESKFNFNTTILKDGTRDQILDAIYSLRDISKDDNILIYYSGHGIQDKASETAYWQPVDAKKNRPSSWINEHQIKSELKALKAKHVMVVADSCFSGALLRGVEKVDYEKLSKKELLNKNFKKRIRIAFTSGGEEPVIDGGGGKNSIFTKSFLEVMNELKEPVEGRYVYNKVTEKLILNANQEPQYDPILNAGGERGGDFVFVPKK